jgi:hypothetical protein
MPKPKSIPLTTETLCKTKTNKCPDLDEYEWDYDNCNKYDLEPDIDDDGISMRCDQCKIDNPEPIVMTTKGAG